VGVKRGTPEHPKTRALTRWVATTLGVPLEIADNYTVGLLERLWHWVAKWAPGGDVSAFDADVLADGVHWPREGAPFIKALVRIGLLDREGGRLLVHDWSEHADEAVHLALIRCGQVFADGSAPRGPSLEVMRLRDEITRLRPELVPMLLERDGHGCRRCGRKGEYHVDHARPLSRGGTNDPTNLQLLCGECNLRKGARYDEAEG
jgi:hypothetical protein